MMSNPRLFGRLAVCGLLVAAAGCRKQQAAPPRPPMAVQTATAIKMDTPVIIKAFGNTEDRESVDVVPQVSGLLMKTFVADGAVVTNGQPLFQIDSRDYAARVRQGEGVVTADRANLEMSRITVERNRALLEKKLIAAESFDLLKTKHEAAAAQLQIDEAALEQARLNLARCQIAAPLTGVCSKRYLDDGNLAAAGMTRLINIRSYDPMDLEFSVSEQYLPFLRRAMAEGTVRLGITPQNDTNALLGVLTSLDNAVNPLTGTILLRGQVPNPEMKLWAKQFVGVDILAGTVHDAVMIPEGAVQFGKMGSYVFAVTKDGKADMRSVKPGVRYGNLIQIMDGVAPDEKVVVLGQLMLYPGAQVAEAEQRPRSGGAPAGAGGK
jgi:RND family efflux transporter MFP subunit